MPMAAIKVTNLFGGHWIRHCFRPKCFIYKTFLLKSQRLRLDSNQRPTA